MNNLAGILNTIEGQKPLVETKGLPWVYRKSLSNGTYLMRGLSNEEKCPDGFRIYTVHEMQRKPVDNKWDLDSESRNAAYDKILCTESYKGWHEVDGKNKLVAPCPVCDGYEDFRQGFDLDEVDEDIVKAFDEMSSASCRKFLYPVLLYAAETDTTDDKGKKKKIWVPNDKQCILVLLNLSSKPYEGNADLTLIKLLSQHIYGDATNLSQRSGRWFRYEKKSNGQSISPDGPACALTEKEMACVKNFPNVNSYGMGDSSSPFAKNYKVGYAKGMAKLSETWFIKHLCKTFPKSDPENGYDFDAIPQGLV
jgi:hypothetical protein